MNFSDPTLIQLFEEQVAKTPQHIALFCQDQQLSYQALNAAANQLASKIKRQAPDTLIAICLDRSIELFIGLLAILKVGAAYVPIDPSVPPERMHFMLKDSNAVFMLTEEKYFGALSALAPIDTKLLAINIADYQLQEAELQDSQPFYCASTANSCLSPTEQYRNRNANNLIYVIYTSGTTGRPKGVMISHKNVINYYKNVSRYFDDLENIDFSTSIAFDLSVTTTLIPLLCGKKIVIYPGELRDIESYVAHLEKNNIDFIKSTPAFLTQVFSLPQSTKIKTCFVGGEKLLQTQLNCILNHCDAVYDEYGPTENTVGTTLIQKTKAQPFNSIIGKPYENHYVFVLDEYQEFVENNVVGELYVGGDGVARGYLNQPRLTAERFIIKNNIRLYKTGDLVRMLPDGNLEYLGRNDFQVKINGYRIELNEIEQALSEYAEIVQNIILARDNTLFAYYVSANLIDENALIAHLRRILPEYMMPVHFIHLTAFPLTSNGKVDREALHNLPIVSTNKTYIAPKTALEKTLCSVWENVLGVEHIGLNDDFFRLGGDSIKCMQVMSELIRDNIHCRVSDIFTHRSIEKLSKVIGKKRFVNTEKGRLKGEFGLLPIQSWFFEQNFENKNHWNQSFLIRVPALSVARLELILPLLIEHHDMLRVCFQNKKQTYGVERYNLKIDSFTEINEIMLTHLQANFDIENGPLWKIGYISDSSEKNARLYFAFHHLMMDSVSWRIIIDDIKRLYYGESLSDKGSSYRQWVNAVEKYVEKNPNEYLFWKNQIDNNDIKPTLSNQSCRTTFTLDKEITAQLIGPANNPYQTEINDLLLSALGLALSIYFGKSSNRISLEGHGREEIDEALDISRTVGWFTSLYPITLTVHQDIASSILAIKSYLRSIPNKGIGYGAYRYTKSNHDVMPSLPAITFNYLGQFDSHSGYWQVVNEYSGQVMDEKNKRPHIFDITGTLIDGSLHMILSSHLPEMDCNAFSRVFEKQLRDITTHCLQHIKNGVEAVHPANSLQKGFIYHAIAQPESDAYRVQYLIDYDVALDIEHYKNAWRKVIATHPILRTYFKWDEQVIQIVSKEGSLNFIFHDLSNCEKKDDKLSEIKMNDRSIPFDFGKATLLRLNLIKLAESHFVVLKNSHHSILDGWSLPILFNQVHAYYRDLLVGKKSDVIVDNSYLVAQHYIATHQHESIEPTSLVDHVNDINALLSNKAPLDSIKAVKTPGQSVITLKNYGVLANCAKQAGLTLNCLVQFAWHKLIQIYTGDDYTTVGTTLSGRSIPVSGIEQSIGLYINTLPMVIYWDETQTIAQQCHTISSKMANLNDHSFVELASLQKNGQGLFHSLYIAEYDNDLDTFDDFPFRSHGTIEVLDYPLALIVNEKNTEIPSSVTQNSFKKRCEKLTLKLKYDQSYLADEKAAVLLQQLSRILHQIPEKLHAPHHEITLLSDADYQKIIIDWNNTKTAYPDHKIIHQLFEEQVLKAPDAVALIFNNEKLTYRQLNNAANQLAHFIRSNSNIKNTLIPICFEHTFEMVISQLAVLKTGAAYVPIDPTYPVARIHAILEDINSQFILTSENLISILPSTIQAITVDKKQYQDQSKNDPEIDVKSDKLAYVIYTSGTTGTPKGVMISHQNVCNYLSSITKNKAYQRGKIVDCSSSIAFDATVAVLLAPLVSGRTVVLCHQDTKRDSRLYISYLKDHHIDLLRMTPSFLSALLATENHTLLQQSLSHVRCLILGGEKTNATDVKTWMTLFPECHVINHYGPTETTVACSILTISDIHQIKNKDNIPLSKPAHNHQFYVLDRFRQPVPIDVIGELYVGGAGVAKGYLNQAQLTAECFIIKNNTRLYKTGDLVKWLPDGNLDFIRRNDFQVKIRGYRVELSEIEKALLEYDGITQCFVTIINDKLVAYYVGSAKFSVTILKKHLENQLPNFMIPSAYVALDAFPLTRNQKLDRKALPLPIWIDEDTQYIAPRNTIESTLCDIWQDVLHIDRVGIYDDFFRLGGHSILAIHLSHKMSQALSRQISIADIFKYKHIASLSDIVQQSESIIDIKPIIQKQAPLSFSQERLWFIEQFSGETDAYHIPLTYSINKNIDIDALKKALSSVIERHDVLRTVFLENKQLVKNNPIEIHHKKTTQLHFQKEKKRFLEKPFNLKTDYPVRLCLFEISENDTLFLTMVFHHIAFDAWSKIIFMNELHQFYLAITERKSLTLPTLSIQYKDFSQWQRDHIAIYADKLISYWIKTLSGYEPLSFQTDYQRPDTVNYRGDSVYFTLPKSVSSQLKTLAESQGMTLYSVLLTGFLIVLSKYTGQTDLLIGTPTTHRHHAQVSNLIGFFVNLLPLRIILQTKKTILDALISVHEHTIEMQQHQDLPFAKLIEHLQIERDESKHPLFQMLFNVDYEDNQIDDHSLWHELKDENDYRRAKLDLSVTLQEKSDCIYATIQYATSLFKRDSIARFAAHYEHVLSDMLQHLNCTIDTYSILSIAEYQKIIIDWNKTEKVYPHKTIHQLFENQVEKTPDKTALFYENDALTYRVLNQKSNQLANAIRRTYRDVYASDLKADTLIALCINRSFDMIISVLAILKAGAAYVPIEPHCPSDRMQFVLEDTKAALLLTHENCVSLVKSACSTHTPLLMVDQYDYHRENKDNLLPYSLPVDLAYVIYTSGTTGLPKGVMVAHDSVTNIVHHIPTEFGLSENSRILHFASIAFDASVLQLFNALTIGATLFIASEKIRQDANLLGHFLKQHCITFSGIPPVLLAHLNPADYPDLTTVIVAGETANAALMTQWCAGRQLMNAYGPTEATIGAATHRYRENDLHTNIGRPLPNLTFYVLDNNKMPVPIGSAGELYIGGAGVARGYLNRPELTNERFIASSFKNGERLYKTGDLVRYLENGDVIFLGRNDSQVKIRGYRIELSEIEQVLLQYDGIEQCVVLCCNQKLVAYYVSACDIAHFKLQTYVAKRLPYYMLPSIFMALPALPLTTNGKLDKKALPVPILNDESTNYAPPRNELESLLCHLWQDALSISRVGIDDDFFRLGGHSILAVHLAHRMSLAVHKTISVSDIFRHKTIAILCDFIQKSDGLINIEPIADNNAPLSFAQERLWFIEQYENGTNAYHIPLTLTLNTDIDLAALKQALQSVVTRHEILRTVFIQDKNGMYKQCVLDLPLILSEKEIDQDDLLREQQAFHYQHFDLTTEYPIRACLFTLSNKKLLLMLVFHHIAFDVWSKTIFLSELNAFYKKNTAGLPILTIQYNDFSLWQRNQVENHSKALISYWKNVLSDAPPLYFPLDYARPAMMDYRGQIVSVMLEPALLEKLNQLAKSNNVTLYSVLLCGFSLVLSKYTDQTDLIIGTPVVNREYPQLNHLIGLFINSVALRIRYQKADSLSTVLHSIQKTVIDAQTHQDLPFEQVIDAMNVSRDTSRHPLFQIMFTLHNNDDVTDDHPWAMLENQGLSDTAKFDLAISIQTSKNGAHITLQYAVALFKKEKMEQLITHYENALRQMTLSSEHPIQSYVALSDMEYQKIVIDWNNTASDYPRNKTIIALFESQAKNTPNNIAIVFENEKMTYKMLDEKSNQLAHFICEHYQNDIKPDALIALCLDRSLDLMIGLLGILKAGAAYVPIDPGYPAHRITYILSDTNCQLVLTQSHLANVFNNIEKLIYVDQKPYEYNSISALPARNKATDLAYVMYTSGTTGSPKGVMIENRSVVALLHSKLCQDITTGTKGLLWTNITFDVSVYEIFSLLLRGGELHILNDEDRLDDKKLFDIIINKKIESCYLPPFFVEKISHYLHTCKKPIFLRKVLLGVEPIQKQHITGLTENNISILNAYGPTETTVSSTAHHVTSYHNIEGKIIPIGSALENESVYVLDSDLAPVPIGVVGELYIGGDGLARGYWNQPELTQSRFIENPFSTGKKLYKTGDLVKYLNSGILEYCGRRDFQVKIHGLRIELGEIENALMMHSDITQAVVLYHEKQLIAYYCGKEITAEDMISFLSTYLSESMVPSAFVYLKTLPLTQNGKLDRKALPLPSTKIKKRVIPRNETDKQLLQIWQTVLGNPEISISDDFFAIGGDSIASLQIISLLRYAHIDCSIKDIFQCRTIERLSNKLLANVTKIKINAEQGVLEGTFDLLPIQQWFFDQHFPHIHHWNQAFLVRVPVLSMVQLQSVMPALINQHDMLRIRFIRNHSRKWQQHYYISETPIHITKHQFETEDSLVSQLNALHNSLNIETGPLWKMAYIDGYADGSARLFFTYHHLIIDTVSWRIIINDLKKLYHHQILGKKTSSYRQWQLTLTNYANANQSEVSFWQKQIKAINYSKDYPLTSQWLTLDQAKTTQLLVDVNAAYHTKIEDLLLTALSYALQTITHENEYAITLESHGRHPIDDTIDLSETVGWFTNLYPLLLTIENTLPDTIKKNKDAIRCTPNTGIGYGALNLSNTLPSIYFNYQGQLNTGSQQDWSVVSEKVGISIHPDNTYDFLILINACVIDGKLKIHFGLKLSEAHCKTVLNIFKKTLNKIIDHCLHNITNQQYAYTPGDFSSVNTEADLVNLPIKHDPISHHQSFEMTDIQKAYALGRLKQFEIGNVANHVYMELMFPALSVSKLEKALNRLIEAYSELRTVFDIDHLTQRYLEYHSDLHYHIKTQVINAVYSESALKTIRNELTHHVYDVSIYPLFYFGVSRFKDSDILHISFDLLLLDAQARMKFFTALTNLYANENHPIQRRNISFRDYQIYTGMMKSSPWYQADKAYWQKKLPNLPLRPKLLLSCDPRNIEKPNFMLNKRVVAAPLWKKFKSNADKHGISYSSVLLSLYGFVLSRFSETSDFLITMTLFNRYGIHPDVNHLWGDFTSTNLFGFSRKSGSAIEFFKYTHDNLLDDISHALYNGMNVQRDLMNANQLDPTMAVSPVVFTCVVGEAKHRDTAPSYFISKDEQIDKRYWIGQTSQAWIDLQATERDGCFSSGWLYVSQLFSTNFIDVINKQYCDLIAHLAEQDWNEPLPSFILPDPHTLMIHKANATALNTPKNTLVSLFDRQVETTPNDIAVIDQHGRYSYHDILIRSTHIANALHENHIKQNKLIAILSEKGINQVISSLGIMRAGAAYLPLNVEWPLGRIHNILIEGQVSHLLVSEAQWDVIKNTTLVNDYTIHRIEKLNSNRRAHLPVINPKNPAYVIFTSGSTGKPKGVCISHAGAVNTIMAVNQQFNINHNDSVLALSELSFDLSVYDIFGVLAAGGTVVFPEQLLSKEPRHWAALIKKHKITIWNSVPQLMQLLLDNADDTINSLRAVLLSGDWVPVSLAQQVKALSSKPIVFSLGGATEASIWSIWYEISAPEKHTTIPYGFPMPNQQMYVLNQFDEHCPIGLAGEIHIGGDGLALEYWNDAEKTAQRFILHPTLGRLYKTGDLGKWSAAGYIEFLGRLDNQVKRNGNRVELDEIATQLTAINGIDHALVRMHDDQLIAYLISPDFKAKHKPDFNVEQFKLTQHGLRADLKNTVTFDVYQFNEIDYRARKSYRRFDTKKMPDDFTWLPNNTEHHSQTQSLNQPHDLALLLSVISAKQIAGKILPKYRYPSAGSTYAVQCTVNIPMPFGPLAAGSYYYHPVLHTLQNIPDRAAHTEFSLEFTVNRYAIETLYGKDYLRMACIELGHMIYLLTHFLAEKNIAYEFTLNNDTHLATLILNTLHQHHIDAALSAQVLYKNQTGAFENANRAYDLHSQTIAMQTSEVGHILESAQTLVIFEGDNHPMAWVNAGFEAQRYMDYWKTHQLGACPLGLRPTENALYALAVGPIVSEDSFTPESHAQGPTLSDALLKRLNQHLPCYMLPQVFITLENLPLTANGKVDIQALPLPDFTTHQQAYAPPRTDIEKTLCSVWEAVLGLPQVSITDDFFRIGGDSILSIHVTTKLRQRGIECNVLSIFEHRSIDRLAPHVTVIAVDDAPSETVSVDLSDDLLKKLQARYQTVVETASAEDGP